MLFMKNTNVSETSPFFRCPRYRFMENGVVENPITFSEIEGSLTLVRVTFMADVTFSGTLGAVIIKNCVFKARVVGHLESESISLYGPNGFFYNHTPGIIMRLSGSAVKHPFKQQADG